MTIITPSRMRQQPQNVPALDWSNSLLAGINEIYLPQHQRGLVKGRAITPQSSSALIRGGQQGMAWQVPTTTTSGFSLGQENTFGFGQECTFFIYRRSFDTTGRVAQLFGGLSGSNRVLIHAPLNDGNCYWDYGNATVGSGRLSVAFTKSTTPETLVFVAGAVKGREIWRNGIKLASNGGTATPTSSTYLIGIGSPNGGLTSDNEEIYLVGIVNRAWSDAECREWSANPWGIFLSPRRLWVPGTPDTPAARPQVFICT